MGFSRQEYWSGLPFPSLGELHNPGIEAMSPALQADSLLLSHLGNPYADFIMWNAELDESQAGIKNAGRNSSNLRYTDDTTLMAESEEELLKSSLWGWKRRMKKLAWNSTFKKLRSFHLVSSLHDKQKGKNRSSGRFSFSWAPKPLHSVIAAVKLKDACSLKKNLWQT